MWASSSSIDVVQITSDSTTWCEQLSLPREQSYLLSIALRAGAFRQSKTTGTCQELESISAHSIHLHDLAVPIGFRLRGPFKMLVLRLPRSRLLEFVGGRQNSGPILLSCEPGTVDPVLGTLAQVLSSVMSESSTTKHLYVEHLIAALVEKLLHSYFRPASPTYFARGGLAPWQERRAKELLSENIDKRQSLDKVARECRLSRGYFSKAFKQTTGEAPHAWLTRRRIAIATNLLFSSETSLAEIAIACGFVDQSHLTRVFTKLVGMSPGHWRRTMMA